MTGYIFILYGRYNTQKYNGRAQFCLILSLLLATSLGALSTNFLVVLLEGSKILTGLGELTLLHTLSDVPVDEGTLGVHEIEPVEIV